MAPTAPSTEQAQRGRFAPDLLAGRCYGVCGLGRNGQDVVNRLTALGAKIYAWDDKIPPPACHNHHLSPHGENPVYTDLASLPDEKFSTFDALILSPGIPHHLPHPHHVAIMAQKLGVPIVSDAEILWQIVRLSGSKARFVSITGTNGKSTTTTLLAHILASAGFDVAAGGNLGTASLALPLLDDHGVYVIEMSSYMLERLPTYHANIALILNITPDHLERHGDMAGYIAAKAHVFDNMGAHDLAIFGEDAPWARAMIQHLAQNHIPFQILNNPQCLSPALAPALPGQHNAQNIEACRLICNFLDVSESHIIEGIRSFPGLAHRLQNIAETQEVRFINDSKATNAEAASHALAAFQNCFWIAGGVAKTGDITALAPFFGHIRHSFLIGQDADKLARTLEAHGQKAGQDFSIYPTLDDAVRAAFHHAGKDYARDGKKQTILLSPACASFDQFRNFEERGAYFTHLAKELTQGTSNSKRIAEKQHDPDQQDI